MKSSAPRLVVVATSNPGKMREIRALLGRLPTRLRSLAEGAPVELPEEGTDHAAAAEAKAAAAVHQLGEWVVAECSGLEGEGLVGAARPL